jgi:hypothetical protein
VLLELNQYLENVLNKYKSCNSQPNKPKRNFYDILGLHENGNQTDELHTDLTISKNDLDDLQTKYINLTTPIIFNYYNALNKNDINSTKQLFDEYCVQVVIENFINLLDFGCSNLKKIYEKYTDLNKFNTFVTTKTFNNKEMMTDLEIANENHELLGQASFDAVVQKYIEYYDNRKINIQIKQTVNDDCVCGFKMIIDSASSHKVCENCGNQIYLPGTVFDDSQFYNQQGQNGTKHKKYDSNRHCERWIEQIQATEDIGGAAFQKIIEILDKRAVREYTRDGKLRSMKNLKCKQIREWLKEYKLTTKWNNHAPLLRKSITSLHGEPISPPQLTKEEKDDILMDFSIDMNLYEELSKKNEVLQLIDKDIVKNKPYYPFGLLKVLCQKLKNDTRLPGLIECIHFQSPSTSVKNDKIYKIICQMRGKKYEPTDRTILVEIS